MTLGEKIKTLRQEKNWSQTELAKMIGVSKQRISKYETDVNNPVFEVLMKLAKIFKVSVDYLIFNETNDLSINDKELLSYFKLADKLSPQRKKIIKELIKDFVAHP